MGWKKRKAPRGGEPRFKKPRTEGETTPQGDGWTSLDATNDLFVQFYKMQNLMDDSEWESFMKTLGQRLPTIFRITGTRSHAECIRETLEREYFPALDVEVEGEAYQKPTPLPWYPNHLAYHCELPRQLLRKVTTFQAFQKFLVNETELGNISRQEAVSMIPPLLLDVRPGHKVLDMCAAPGSKTGQLIEMIHANDDPSNPTLTDGLVVANDLDNKRCHLLVHQVKRLQSPCLMVTNQNAAHFPTIYQPGPMGKRVPLMFDRVLCDVPCSGDGTLRKNPGGWKTWGPMQGTANHSLQIRIFTRGCQMLSVGGYIVYSTCTFHPLENEAVVAEVLRTYKGKLELVDASDRLPELKRRPGLLTWKVMAPAAEGSSEWKAVDSIEDVIESKRSKYQRSMWPQEDVADLHLERCMRILPQDQNTGGFFIAVLKKTSPLSSLDHRVIYHSKEAAAAAEAVEVEAASPESTTTVETMDTVDTVDIPSDATSEASFAPTEPETKDEPVVVEEKIVKAVNDPKLKPLKEDPFVFVSGSVAEGKVSMKGGDELLKPIIKYYQLPENFPLDQLMVRTTDGKGRFLYLVSSSVRNVILGNQDIGLRIINTGVKIFGRSEAGGVECDFRLQQEGIQSLGPMVSARTITALFDDVVMLLKHQDGVRFDQVSEELQKKMIELGAGSVVMHFDPKNPECKASSCLTTEELRLCIWVGRKGVRPMVSTKECHSNLVLMLGPDRAAVVEEEVKVEKAKSLADFNAKKAAEA
eukprot:Ihof_evm11s90 gene=Ihof_evmTU11s90